MQQQLNINEALNKTISQIDIVKPDSAWILKDLANMRVVMRSRGANIDELLKHKKEMMRHVWKLGKAHELLHLGLLNKDGSLTQRALEVLEQQKSGKIPSGVLPGGVYIEIGQIKKRKVGKSN